MPMRRVGSVGVVGRLQLRSFHPVSSSSAKESTATASTLDSAGNSTQVRKPLAAPSLRPRRKEAQTITSSAVVNAQSSAKPKQAEEPVTPSDESHLSQTTHTAPEAGPSMPQPKPTDPVSLLPPSPLSVPHPTPPIPASSPIKALISDFQLSLSLSHLIPPNPKLPTLQRWLHIGKQLFKFYWNALKVLWADVGRAREIKTRPQEEWSRREMRLVKRTKADLWKLVPFVAILCILVRKLSAVIQADSIQEELLPLLVLYAPNSLPSTTILPAQLIRIKDEEQTRRKAALFSYAKSILEPLPSPIITALPADNIKQLCKVYELGTLAPTFWLRRRLRKHLEFISRDDEMLRKEVGDVKQALSIEEKRLALAERGM